MNPSSPRSSLALAQQHDDDRAEVERGSNVTKSPVKRHKCPKPGCGKAFSRPSHLARHALNHSATEFHCSRCTASFKRRDLLERHKARHASKDRMAGGLGLGILRTKWGGLGHVAIPPSLQTTNSSSSYNALMRSEEAFLPGHEGMDVHSGFGRDPALKINSSETTLFQQAPPQAAEGFAQFTLDAGSLDIPELGDMYHDSSFDTLHFNVTGDMDPLADLISINSIPAQHATGILHNTPFGTSMACRTSIDILNGPFPQSPPNHSSELELQSPGSNSSRGWIKEASGTFEDLEDIYSLGGLGLDNLHLTQRKRGEILGLINDMRPVHPDGSLIDENTAHFSLARMQEHMDLFFTHFNSCYPLVHSPTLDVSDAEPLFLLAMMVLGATYKGKDEHQLSVCIYDAMMPYIMSGVVVTKVPELSILQTYLILECYGMYRAGAYQRENAILMHTFLFNAIRRLSRYHVRARIMLPDLMTSQNEDWKVFAYTEQYKRLILFVFMWDTQNVSYYSFMPSMSTQSIQVALPCSKELWDAENEGTWRALSSKHLEPSMINQTVKDVVENGGNISCRTFDSLSLSLILHGLMSMCNDMVHFNNQSIFLSNVAEGDVKWAPWRRRMIHALELWKTKYDAHAMETRQSIDEDSALHAFREESVAFLALYHTAHIIVNADVRHLQIAAGAKAIFGHVVTSAEHEESTKIIQQWVKSSPESAAHAAWQAAQMFREVLLNLRDWRANGMFHFHYPWCLYVGALTCWAFIHFSPTDATDESDMKRCQHSFDEQDSLQTQSKALMHQTVSNIASSSPENIHKVLNRCCPHGLAIEVAKYLKTVRWTAAFEAMKVLQGIGDLDSPNHVT